METPHYYTLPPAASKTIRQTQEDNAEIKYGIPLSLLRQRFIYGYRDLYDYHYEAEKPSQKWVLRVEVLNCEEGRELVEQLKKYHPIHVSERYTMITLYFIPLAARSADKDPGPVSSGAP